MQRRDFVRTALFGTGAACTFALPALASAIRTAGAPVSVVLARAEPMQDRMHWLPIQQCSSGACVESRRIRVAIEALSFPPTFGPVSIDAMFTTRDGLRPFRVAVFRPDSMSPASKPFSFEVDEAGLAGFRIEQTAPDSGRTTTSSSSVLGAARPVLARGRYLLAIGGAGTCIDLESVDVPQQAQQPLALCSGAEPAFAYLSIAVSTLEA